MIFSGLVSLRARLWKVRCRTLLLVLVSKTRLLLLHLKPAEVSGDLSLNVGLVIL